MKETAFTLALRKERLRARIASERAGLLQTVVLLERAEAGLSPVVAGARWMRAHAGLLLPVALGALLWKPHLLGQLARRGWVGWQVLRRTLRWLDDAERLRAQVRRR